MPTTRLDDDGHPEIVDDEPEKVETIAERARAQSAEKLGLTAGVEVAVIDGETIFVPNAGMLDEDQQQRYNEYLYELESLDLDEDGEPKFPHRRDKVLLEPSNVRLAKAIFGPDLWVKLRAAGVRAGDVNLHWMRMNKELADRQAEDSKSVGRLRSVAPVSE